MFGGKRGVISESATGEKEQQKFCLVKRELKWIAKLKI